MTFVQHFLLKECFDFDQTFSNNVICISNIVRCVLITILERVLLTMLQRVAGALVQGAGPGLGNSPGPGCSKAN